MAEYLPIGYRLKLNSRPGEYIITKVIGRGASTIAYLTDYVNQSGMHSERIIKEFYPNHLDISRSDDGTLVCAEKDLEKFAQRKARFVEGGDRQNALRQRTRLKNETPPLQEVLDANNTKYLEVTSFEGKTLNHVEDFSMVERVKFCLTVAKLVSRYHAEGFLCLDIKPENIFILSNSAGEVVPDMVEFIDFDSVIEKDQIAFGNTLSYTSNWAAPEQINSYGYKKISEATDIYAIGELVFWIVFGRHSTSEEHRSFSEYPFDAPDAPFAKVLSRRAVQKLLTKLFRHTLRSSVHNRFATMDKVIDLLQKLTAEVEKKEFILDYKIRPKAFFIGRDRELAEIDAALQEHSVVFVSGIAGIGKSELVKQYACSHVDAYDNILYWTYEGNLDSMVASDASVAISNFSRIQEESDFQYAKRKIEEIRELLNGHNNFMVIDNLDVLVEELPQQETWQLLKDLPCQILITTRCAESLYKTLTVKPLADAGDLVLLFQQICPFDDGETDAVKLLIQSVGGDTLLVELLAHHTKAVHAHPRQTLEKLHSGGIGGLSGGAVRLLKDDRVTTDTVFSHIEKIFSMVGV